jgi:hypothetical protein
MNQSQVDDVVRAKTAGDKRHFGDIAVSLGFITAADVEAFLTAQKWDPPTFVLRCASRLSSPSSGHGLETRPGKAEIGEVFRYC